MVNAWVEHVRQYAKEHGVTYACAIPDAAKTYTKKSVTSTKPVEQPKPREKQPAVQKPQPIKQSKPPPRKEVEQPKPIPKPKEPEPYLSHITPTQRELAFAKEEWERISKMQLRPRPMPDYFVKETTERIRKQQQADKEREMRSKAPDPPKAQAKPKAPEPPKASELQKSPDKDNLSKFYDVLAKGFKSTRNVTEFRKTFGADMVSDTINAQLNGLDFYSTPPHCILNHKILTNIIKDADLILEPTCGLGALVYSAIHAGASRNKIHANDVIPSFVNFVQKQLNVNTTNDNFLTKSYSNNKYDLIMLNPPFSSGTNKLFYFDFLYKAVAVLRDSKAGSLEKHIIFISPELNKPSANRRDVIGEEEFRLSKSKKQELLAKNGFDKDDDPFYQIQLIGECKGFGGTKVTAIVYLIIIR